MDEARNIIERLRARIEGVAAENRAMHAAVEKATDEIGRLKADRKMLLQRIAELEHKLTVAELAEGFACVSENSGAAKERVNKLLREVDNCIKLMNR